MIPKSEVGVLSSDSKNVVHLIESAYNVSCQFTNGLDLLNNTFLLIILCYFSLSHNTTLKCVIHDRGYPQK